MKNLVSALLILACVMVNGDDLKASVAMCVEPYCNNSAQNGPFTGDQSTFRRTYHHKSRVHRYKVNRMAQPRGGNGPVITKADMEEHFGLDKSRRLTIIPKGTLVSMDVKGIDEDGDQPQVWDMPDFMDFSPEVRDIQHITPESSGYGDEYPEATHCFYQATDGIYRMFELTEDDLFALGAIHEDENEEADVVDLFYSLSPLPLEWGLEFIGEVIIEYTEDPDVDSTITLTNCLVVAHGTLNTYDDGPVPSLKLHVTVSFRDYKDGQVINESSDDYVVWYGKEGHYLVGLLEPGTPFTDEVTFTNMLYYQISESVSVDPVINNTPLHAFPNPVSAGEVLTISHDADRHYGLIRLYDMQGRLMHQVDMSGMGAVRHFQIQLPPHLVTGIYTYRALAPSGTLLGQGKLNVR